MIDLLKHQSINLHLCLHRSIGYLKRHYEQSKLWNGQEMNAECCELPTDTCCRVMLKRHRDVTGAASNFCLFVICVAGKGYGVCHASVSNSSRHCRAKSLADVWFAAMTASSSKYSTVQQVVAP